MFGSVVTVALIASLVVSVTAAVDAFRYSAQEWQAARQSQSLRLAVILSPLLAFLCLPVGAAIALYYAIQVRPALLRHKPPPVSQAAAPDRRRVGFAAVWRELSSGHKARIVVAGVLAVIMEVGVWNIRDQGDAVPAWAFIVLAPITLTAFFVAAYLGLWLAQIFLPFLANSPDTTLPRQERMRRAAVKERNAWQAAEAARRQAEQLRRRQQ
jgi:hypothetical protein